MVGGNMHSQWCVLKVWHQNPWGTLYCLAMLLSWPSSTSLNLFSRLLSWTSIVSTNFRSLWVRWSRTSMDWLMFWTWMKITYRRWLTFLAVFGNFSATVRHNRSVLWLNCAGLSHTVINLMERFSSNTEDFTSRGLSWTHQLQKAQVCGMFIF